MSKVNEVWSGVCMLVPYAQFMYWSELRKSLQFFDPDNNVVMWGKLMVQNDGSMQVEVWKS